MRKHHVISVKRMGRDNGDSIHENFFFPFDECSKDEAITQFRPIQKQTLKNNKRRYPYTAYEYNGETFYYIKYRRMANESEI